MKKLLRMAFISMLCLIPLLSFAQKGDTIEVSRNEKGKISFARIKPENARKIQEGKKYLKDLLQAKQNDEFSLIKETSDDIGYSHIRFQQHFKGVKVENAEYLLHGKNGIIESINGNFEDVDIPSVTPSVNEQDALSKAIGFVNAKKYKWEDADMEKFIKQNTNNLKATYYPTGELVITRDFLKGGHNLRLAWKFTISSLIPNNEQWIYVDATSGEIIRETPLILDGNVNSTAETLYSGIKGIVTDSFTSGYRLRESRNGVSIQTMNLQGTFNYSNAVDFVNTNTSWTSSSWGGFVKDRSALDAHLGAENVLDYWKSVHNRNSINGNGIRVLSYVHAGSNWSNAQWVGGTNNYYMQYGDGEGYLFQPLTALDICAHEMGHGITEFTAGLVYGTQESAALNEGFSDIWAACVEYWADPNKQTWLMGEEIFKQSAYTCIRNLQNPKSTTTYEGQHPDTYHGNYWNYGGEPHCNSTVLSHWFYLLVNGGNGKNDIGNTYCVFGIGINSAQRIAYRAESMYLNSSATYNDARNTLIQAAIDLFGIYSPEVMAVTNAWYAVGVGTPSQYVSSISGPSTLCYGNSATYSITNLPNNAVVKWSINGMGLTSVSETGGTFTATPSYIGGKCSIRATITTSNGTFEVAPKEVSTNGYQPIGGPDVVDLSHPYEYYTMNASTIQQWRVNYDVYQPSYSNPSLLAVHLNKYYPYPMHIFCAVTTGCGTFTATKDVQFIGGSPDPNEYSIYPNPTANSFSIKRNEEEQPMLNTLVGDKGNTDNLSVVIYNDQSQLVRQQNICLGQSISTGNLREGLYIIHISDGKKVYKKKLIIRRN